MREDTIPKNAAVRRGVATGLLPCWQARRLGVPRDIDSLFRPDLLLIWGDDQFENFKRDCIPTFSIGIFDKVVSQPFGGGKIPFGTAENVLGLPADTELTIPCHYDGAAGLCRALLEGGFDIAYSRTVRTLPASHNTVLYLDYERQRFGLDYPIVPFHVNCYGHRISRTDR